MLCIAYQKRADVLFVQHCKQLIDMGVEDRFSNQTQCAMSNPHRLAESLTSHTRHTFHHLDLLIMTLFHAVKDELGWVDLPAPSRAYRIGAVAPAENALVAAAQRRRCFHTKVR